MQKSFVELIYLSICKIITFFIIPSARLIRLPIDIRGKNNIHFGKKLTTGYHCRIETYPLKQKKEPVLFLGDNIQINDFVHIAAANRVEIGNNVLIASKVFISDICHGNYFVKEKMSTPQEPPQEREISTKSVIIHDNVWIGEMVSILPGVEIGEGSIIGAGSVVTKMIPKYSIAAGNPAKIIKKYNQELRIWEKC